MALQLTINALIQEIEHVRRATHKFLVDDHPLTEVKRQLEQLNRIPTNTPSRIHIPLDRPLVTKPSNGDYQIGGEGQLSVYGTISFVWIVTVIGEIPNRAITLNGLLSTTVRIIDFNSGNVVATWNFDIGNAESPGCHFHVQAPWPLLGANGDWPAVHSNFDIPRLPIPIVAPTDALEFMLGELFQEAWPRHRAAFQNPFQSKRMIDLLEWQIKKVRQGHNSAWQALKAAKPHPSDKLFDAR